MSPVIIDPRGDVSLNIQHESLLVSSKVLSLASPVFEAMFKPHFTEGTQLQTKKDQPLTVPLSEDNVDALILLCNVVHYRSQEIPLLPGPSCLENLAVVCDKYQCTASIASHVTLWLQRELQELSSDDLNRLLLVAYVLDLPKPFSAISVEILFRQEGPFTSPHDFSDHPLVRHDLIGA